jgi:hypothetical protein
MRILLQGSYRISNSVSYHFHGGVEIKNGVGHFGYFSIPAYFGDGSIVNFVKTDTEISFVINARSERGLSVSARFIKAGDFWKGTFMSPPSDLGINGTAHCVFVTVPDEFGRFTEEDVTKHLPIQELNHL